MLRCALLFVLSVAAQPLNAQTAARKLDPLVAAAEIEARAADRIIDTTETLLTRALHLRRTYGPPDAPELFLLMADLADVHLKNRKNSTGFALYGEAITGLERALGPDHPTMLLTLARLAKAHSDNRDYQSADAMFRRALDTLERTQGVKSHDTLTVALQFARHLYEIGNTAEADRISALVVDSMANATDQGTAADLTMLRKLLDYQVYAYDEPGAKKTVLQYVAVSTRLFGEHPAHVADRKESIRRTISRLRPAHGETHEEKSLRLSNELFGKDHSESLWFAKNLIRKFFLDDRAELAADLVKSYREIALRTISKESKAWEQVREQAYIEGNVFNYEAATELQEKWIKEAESALGAGSEDFAVQATRYRHSCETLSSTAFELKRPAAPMLYARLEQCLKRQEQIHAQVFGTAEVGKTFASKLELAKYLNSAGRFAEAEPLLLEVVQTDFEIGKLGKPELDQIASVIVDAGEMLGSEYTRRQYFSEAESVYIVTIERLEALYGRSHPQMRRLLVSLADVLGLQDRDDKAEVVLLRALEIRPDELRYAEAKIVADYLEIMYQASKVYISQNKLDLAADMVGRANDLISQRGDKWTFDYRHQVQVAKLHEARKEFKEAQQVYNELLAREGGSSKASVELLLDTGRVAAALNEHDKAEAFFDSAFQKSRKDFGDQDLASLASAASLVKARLAQPARASAALTPARLLISGLRERRERFFQRVLSDGQALSEHAGMRGAYQFLADALWAAREDGTLAPGGEVELFDALQDSLLGSVSGAAARGAARRAAEAAGGKAGALARTREAVAAKLQRATEQYQRVASATGQDPAVREALAREINASQKEIASVERDLRLSFPRYFSIVNSTPLPLVEAQSMLAADEAVVLMVPTIYGTHVAALTADKFEWRRAALTTAQLADAVDNLRAGVGAESPTERGAVRVQGSKVRVPPFDRQTAHKLYRELFEPLAGILAGKRHVFTNTGDSLSHIPLHILITEPPEGLDTDPEALRATKWLADRYAMIQIPSVQSLALLRSGATRDSDATGSGGFVGFGDPNLDDARDDQQTLTTAASNPVSAAKILGPSRSGAQLADVRRIKELPGLPGTAVELEEMRKAFDAPESAVFTKSRATETNVKRADLQNASVLAFATHGLLSGEVDGAVEPGLIFTPPNSATPDDDGLLTASEISALRLQADWVILSACNTAGGDGTKGASGLSGIARSFFLAGARNVLATYWPVRDDVAPVLTVRTIKIASEQPNLSRAEAFQQAMREVRDSGAAQGTWAHPSAWAPFALVGDAAR